ncbi:MAG: type II secretion system protein [Tissierellia bacterium]|nr:type II secretion system protein [Tissierellia bacterium]
MEILKRNGFTLIEILVVLGLVAMLLTISIFNLSLIGKIEERDMVRLLVRDLENIRSDAMINKRATSFQAFNDNNFYTLIRNKGDVSQTSESVYLPEDWTFKGSSTIDFGNKGIISSTVTIAITDDKGKTIYFTVGVATARIIVKEVNR